MGTRSRVGVMHGDVVKSVYCHYDGYLEYTGRILQEHYGSAEANDLVSRGDNSGVQKTVAEMNFYSQRGETDVDWRVANTFEEFLEQVDRCCGEWYYIMRDGVWYVGNLYDRDSRHYRKLVPLSDSLAEIIIEAAIAE